MSDSTRRNTGRLTDDEWRVINHLSAAHEAFVSLPEHHPADIGEWVVEIHHLQNRVMARAAVRSDPTRFTPMVSSAVDQPLHTSEGDNG